MSSTSSICNQTPGPSGATGWRRYTLKLFVETIFGWKAALFEINRNLSSWRSTLMVTYLSLIFHLWKRELTIISFFFFFFYLLCLVDVVTTLANALYNIHDTIFMDWIVELIKSSPRKAFDYLMGEKLKRIAVGYTNFFRDNAHMFLHIDWIYNYG